MNAIASQSHGPSMLLVIMKDALTEHGSCRPDEPVFGWEAACLALDEALKRREGPLQADKLAPLVRLRVERQKDGLQRVPWLTCRGGLHSLWPMDEVRRRLADADRRVALLADDRPAGEPEPIAASLRAKLEAILREIRCAMPLPPPSTSTQRTCSHD